MALAKIPLILVSTGAIRLSCTPPNPPPDEKDRLGLEAFGTWYSQRFLKLFTIVDFFLSALEIFTILIFHLDAATIAYASKYFPLLTQLHSSAANIYLTSITILASLMMLTGALIRFTAFRALGKMFTFEASIQRDHRLITNGLYSLVRHPSYSAFLILNPGWFIWHLGEGSFFNATGLTGSWWGRVSVIIWGLTALGVAPLIGFGRIHAEDRALKKKCGKEWDEYAKRVPYCIIPGVY